MIRTETGLPTTHYKKMTKVPINEAKDRLTALLKEAEEEEEVLITRHGRPAGILIGFADEKDCFDCKLENDPRFEARIARSRDQKRRGDVIRLEDIKD